MYIHCTENHIFLFQTSWKDRLSKKIALEYDLSCLIGKDYFSFSRKHIFFFRRKMKYDLSRKKYMETRYFLQMFWKDDLLKKIALGYVISRIIWKDGISFPENLIVFLWTENEKWSFSRNAWNYDIFCIYV